MAKTKEQREETKYIRELRKQIERLKRENQQLRKRNSRIENDFADYTAEIEEEVEKVLSTPIKKTDENADKIECPKCGSRKDVYQFTLREMLYYKCNECGSKGRHETK